MKKIEVKIGGWYIARVSGKKTIVKIWRESPYGGWDAHNLTTGKPVRIRTAARLKEYEKQ